MPYVLNPTPVASNLSELGRLMALQAEQGAQWTRDRGEEALRAQALAQADQNEKARIALGQSQVVNDAGARAVALALQNKMGLLPYQQMTVFDKAQVDNQKLMMAHPELFNKDVIKAKVEDARNLEDLKRAALDAKSRANQLLQPELAALQGEIKNVLDTRRIPGGGFFNWVARVNPLQPGFDEASAGSIAGKMLPIGPNGMITRGPGSPGVQTEEAYGNAVIHMQKRLPEVNAKITQLLGKDAGLLRWYPNTLQYDVNPELFGGSVPVQPQAAVVAPGAQLAPTVTGTSLNGQQLQPGGDALTAGGVQFGGTQSGPRVRVWDPKTNQLLP